MRLLVFQQDGTDYYWLFFLPQFIVHSIDWTWSTMRTLLSILPQGRLSYVHVTVKLLAMIIIYTRGEIGGQIRDSFAGGRCRAIGYYCKPVKSILRTTCYRRCGAAQRRRERREVHSMSVFTHTQGRVKEEIHSWFSVTNVW